MRKAASAGDLLEHLLESLGLSERIEQCRALVVWDEVVGDQIARQTRPLRMREGVLEVTVAQPVWMQQLQLMKPQILKRLNERLGGTTVTDIFLKRGRLQPRPEEEPELPPLWTTVTLSAEESRQIREAVAKLEDPELRREMQAFLEKQARLSKARQDV